MNDATQTCDSCGMPIEVGPYCSYCIDADGQLQDFATRFERMVGWAMRKNSELSRAEAEAQTIAYMANMPAWRHHPIVVAKLSHTDP
jgi:hypothetical protein